MKFIGIDIGSTCAKTVVMNENKEIVLEFVQPTGWSSVDTAEEIRKKLVENDADPAENVCVATGYGRVSVPYADKMITEITCHAMGAVWIFDNKDMTIIDIGGQDTKIICVEQGFVKDFMMNDKCSAGTGRFLEIMANTLSMRPNEMCELAREGSGVTISSMCTVFAESEVISLIGQGEKKENIAFAVVDSIVRKVAAQANRMSEDRPIIFSSDSEEMISPKEIDQSTMKRMEELPNLQTFRLTNRIRTNAELSSFIQNMMHLPVRKNQNEFPHVSVVYANDAKEADTLVQDYVRQGYQYFPQMEGAKLGSTAVRDTEQMVVVLDERYYYDDELYFRSIHPMRNGQSEVRSLFHLLNQAKENLTFVVKGNETVYGILLDMK